MIASQSQLSEGAEREASASRNDLFLAFIAPTGTDLNPIQGSLKEFLDKVGYELIEVKLSERLKNWIGAYESDRFEQIKKCMDAGDKLRKLLNEKTNVAGLVPSIVENLGDPHQD